VVSLIILCHHSKMLIMVVLFCIVVLSLSLSNCWCLFYVVHVEKCCCCLATQVDCCLSFYHKRPTLKLLGVATRLIVVLHLPLLHVTHVTQVDFFMPHCHQLHCAVAWFVFLLHFNAFASLADAVPQVDCFSFSFLLSFSPSLPLLQYPATKVDTAMPHSFCIAKLPLFWPPQICSDCTCLPILHWCCDAVNALALFAWCPNFSSCT